MSLVDTVDSSSCLLDLGRNRLLFAMPLAQHTDSNIVFHCSLLDIFLRACSFWSTDSIFSKKMWKEIQYVLRSLVSKYVTLRSIQW